MGRNSDVNACDKQLGSREGADHKNLDASAEIYRNESSWDTRRQVLSITPSVSVACDMRYAKNADGNRLFTRSEFLTTQQVQSYFSRQAGELRHQHAEYDHEAAVKQQQYWETQAKKLQEVQLQHPVTYDNFNLCAMYHANKLNQLSVSMLKCICKYFDVSNEQLTVRRKAPYIALIEKLIQSCTCHDQRSQVFRVLASGPCFLYSLCLHCW